MDFPIFHADFFGNRFLIGFISVVHVIINHGFAVGMIPLITSMEWWARRTGKPEWDELARKILFVCFIVTTSVGALTGVGIWFSTAVVNPYAIGSLLRVFFFYWAAEWIVFCIEVTMIMWYYLSWKKMTGERKSAHIRIGVVLSLMSWLTMFVIVAVLGFMMNPGAWLMERNFFSGVMNPVYIPQLGFRTFLALSLAGSLALALITAFTKRGSDLRASAVRFTSGWTLFFLMPMLVWSVVYYKSIPKGMLPNLPVSFGTIAFEAYYGDLLTLTYVSFAIAALVCLFGLWRPRMANSVYWILPVVLFMSVMAQFERARQFVRKPYVIGYYMYSNTVRVEDVPYLTKTGLLANSVWTKHRKVTKDNAVEAGKDIFMIACSRCHTVNGINSIRGNLEKLYPGQWDAGAIEMYIRNIHGARPYMPPFVGTAEERAALAAYLAGLQNRPDIVSSPAVASQGARAGD
jgi:mono/diheme cytochrome c family protein